MPTHSNLQRGKGVRVSHLSRAVNLWYKGKPKTLNEKKSNSLRNKLSNLYHSSEQSIKDLAEKAIVGDKIASMNMTLYAYVIKYVQDARTTGVQPDLREYITSTYMIDEKVLSEQLDSIILEFYIYMQYYQINVLRIM